MNYFPANSYANVKHILLLFLGQKFISYNPYSIHRKIAQSLEYPV